MVAAVSIARLAVPRVRSAAADLGTATEPRLPHGCTSRGPGHMGHAAHPAALLCHAFAGERHRRTRDPGAARARQARHHGAPVGWNAALNLLAGELIQRREGRLAVRE